MTALRMNSPLGKEVLAAIRGGDYAHPGEAEAIELVWAGLPKNPAQSVLDAGCGRAGTAAYVQRHGWGKVTGFDVDAESIAEARATYTDLNLEACDVLAAPSPIGARQRGGFDVIYLMNAFYAFPDQPGALRALRALASPAARLAIFDYTDADGAFAHSPPGTGRFRYWKPIEPGGFADELTAAGWKLDSTRDLTPEYHRWYMEFLVRIAGRRAELEKRFGGEIVQHVHGYYTDLLGAIDAGHLGGALYYATAAQPQ